MSDVVADAMVAERAKQHENGAGDIQSLCWACLAVGGTIGAASSGASRAAPLHRRHSAIDDLACNCGIHSELLPR